MKKYETEAEAEALKYINKVYPNAEIINPAELEFKDIKKYLKIVSKCARVVASELDGFVGKGVFAEISRAFSCDVPVEAVRLKEGSYHLLRVNGIQVINEHDWKIKYAKLILNN